MQKMSLNILTEFIYAERARIETPCDFKLMHSRVMTWQAHYSGQSTTPLQQAGV